MRYKIFSMVFLACFANSTFECQVLKTLKVREPVCVFERRQRRASSVQASDGVSSDAHICLRFINNTMPSGVRGAALQRRIANMSLTLNTEAKNQGINL